MLVRVFQVKTRPGQEGNFTTFFYDTAIPLMKSTPGLQQVVFGAARPETPREFCIVMVWESLEALKSFAGDDWQDPHILPEEAAIVESRSIKHYAHVAA